MFVAFMGEGVMPAHLKDAREVATVVYEDETIEKVERMVRIRLAVTYRPHWVRYALRTVSDDGITYYTGI